MGLFTPLIGRLTGKRPDLTELPEDVLLNVPSAEGLLNTPNNASTPAAPVRPNVSRHTAPLYPPATPAPSYGPPADNPFQPVIDALHRGLHDFASKQLQADLYINPRYRFQITRIDLRPYTAEAEQCLQTMLARYPAAHLAGFMQRTLFTTLPNGKHIDTRHFEGIQRLPLPPPAPPLPGSPEARGADFASICAELGEAAPPPPGQPLPAFECFIHGRLVEEAMPDALVAPAATAHPAHWYLHDALGERETSLEPAGSEAPVLLGKGEQNTLVLHGTFISSLHGKLWFDEGRWWYQDSGSTNGSRVEAPDGSEHCFLPVREGAGHSIAPPVPLPPGSRIVCGTTVAGLATPQTAHAYPTLQVPFTLTPATGAPLPGATPVAAVTTPLVPTAPVTPPVALLLVCESPDQQVPRRIPLTAAALPFLIGRSSQQSLTVPDVHRSVSGSHLRLEQVTEAGMEIGLIGQNGARRGEAQLPNGYHGLWAWGETLLLGQPQDGEPPYSLQLMLPDA